MSDRIDDVVDRLGKVEDHVSNIRVELGKVKQIVCKNSWTGVKFAAPPGIIALTLGLLELIRALKGGG